MRLLLLTATTLAAFAPNLNPVSWRLEAAPGHFKLHASIVERYKLYAPGKSGPGPIPLQAKPISPAGLKLGRITAPKAGSTLSGEVTLTIPFQLPGSIPPAGIESTIEIRYQSCSDEICLPPTTRTLTARLLPANPVL